MNTTSRGYYGTDTTNIKLQADVTVAQAHSNAIQTSVEIHAAAHLTELNSAERASYIVYSSRYVL